MNIKDSAIKTFKNEANALFDLERCLTEDFEKAVLAVKECKGRLIVTGVGKSGLIGAKIAATFASTGTPSFFIHPVEAFHGDLGMITKEDIVLAISNSGESDEILRLIPYLENNNIPIIAITSKPKALLAKHAKYVLNIGVDKEACPLNLAPTTSTTATLVMGDAFAIALMEVRQFREEDFARFHPGGNLGFRLLTQVKDLMHKKNLPVVSRQTKISNLIIEISKAKLGLAVIVEDKKVLGVVTDGDVRRCMQMHGAKAFEMEADMIMTKSPVYILQDSTIMDAEAILKKHQIHSLLVYDNDLNLVGVLDSLTSIQ